MFIRKVSGSGGVAIKSTSFLQRFGIDSAQHIGFIKGYLTDSEYVLFDGTNIVRDSKR